MACTSRVSLDIANNLTINAQTALKNHLPLDSAAMPDQGFNAVSATAIPLLPIHRHLD
jgi:hypothetical protein